MNVNGIGAAGDLGPLEDNIAKHYPQQISTLKERISGFVADIQTVKKELPADKGQFMMKVGNKDYVEKKRGRGCNRGNVQGNEPC